MTESRSLFGRAGFIAAAVGSAIGLGNIWKFPYITYANEGGSFVLVYLAAVVMVGAPLLLAEFLLGRHTGRNPFGAFVAITKDRPGGRLWSAFGFLPVITISLVGGYYYLVAGWTLYYCIRCVGWALSGFDLTPTEVSASFNTFLANGPLQIGVHLSFTVITGAIVLLGVKSGIERVTKIVMPLLGGLLLLLAIAAIPTPGFSEALRFLFHIGPLSADALLEAVGHSFFTLGVGMGILITYSSYMSKKQSIVRSGLLVCVLDTLVGLVACIVMFSIIFGVPEAERATAFSKSATIMFTTLPHMLFAFPLGQLLAPLFYFLVAFAALTSTISGLEMLVSVASDELGWSRTRAVLVISLVFVAIAIPTALSVGAHEGLSNWQPFGELSRGVFDTFDYTVSNWLLPITGLGLSLVLGWVVLQPKLREEFEIGHGQFKTFPIWQFLIRVVSPIAILWILWEVIGGRSFA